ncbi:uncharacterized protein N7459_001329 [Penicillium hispanicum]|uniref:uncharacterized protein n=1 Tax=Penicillium hispanicum TaxID=1080232 RepID=UPI002541CBAC|nr:uncharacterized protein N7459_001329 [Penicillium hispanicum]KAJ5595121.1 hypothetical protein N7459_001329 [Penicillium hispanicum]
MAGRTVDDLELAGYRPVWNWQLGYPGEIPEDITEHLYPTIETTIDLVGPLSSLFWLAGAERLCDLITDPAYSLKDEIVGIPHGVGRRWIIRELFDEGKIPGWAMDEVFDEAVLETRLCSPLIAQPSEIPGNITSSVHEYSMMDIFPLGRQQSIPNKILCVKTSLKHKSNHEKNATDLMNRFVSSLGRNLLFKGLKQSALVRLMAFFIPVIQSSHVDNELGPGFYTSPSLKTALGCAGPRGAVMVFKDLDARNLQSLQLSSQDWETTILFWTGRPISNIHQRIPEGWQVSDLLEGAISRAEPHSTRRIPGETTQVVGVSPAGVQAFASALRMIIWIE